MEDALITIKDFSSRNTETINLAEPIGGHAGGDAGFVVDFVQCVRDSGGLGRNAVKNSFESHYMAFAAEKSRLENGTLIRLENIRA